MFAFVLNGCGNSSNDGGSSSNDNTPATDTTPSSCEAAFVFFPAEDSEIVPSALYLNGPAPLGFKSPGFENNQVDITLVSGPYTGSFMYGTTFYAEEENMTMREVYDSEGELFLWLKCGDTLHRLEDRRCDTSGCLFHFLLTDNFKFGPAPGSADIIFDDDDDDDTDTTVTPDTLTIAIVGYDADSLRVTSDIDGWIRQELTPNTDGNFVATYPNVGSGDYELKARDGEIVISADGTIPDGTEVWAKLGDGEAVQVCEASGTGGALKIAVPLVDTCD
jgi:hypothetical protein